ncbi:MAG: virulence factor family protein, partial [Blastococcus sp.]|nr:virulence factor family protein [Blastococcus sp.]
VLGAAGGLALARGLGADPVPAPGMLAAVGSGLLVAALVLGIVGAVMMATARHPLAGAVRALRAPDRRAADRPESDRQVVHGD